MADSDASKASARKGVRVQVPLSAHKDGLMAFVDVTVQDHVAEISLVRVEAHNALSTAMMAELGRACASVIEDSTVRVAVLSSADPAMFCVGADLKERARLDLDG